MNDIKDHKQIGQELELFFTHEIAPGAPFWLPRGMIIFKELEKYIRDLTSKADYQETSTPIMIKSELFKQSGHWEKFGEHNMYNLILSDEEDDSKPLSYTLKPMNCPESTILYRFRPRSYRELPLRFSELGRLHRREKSGEVNGLLRVRQLTMDDAHIYATEDQIMEEISKILHMMIGFYDKFGFEYSFRLATRPELFAGSVENWERAEKGLGKILKDKNLNYSIKDKDGAFYGPKIDVHIKDAHAREWQLATVQLDFHMPEAFKLVYVDNNGTEKRPVMIHRAIFGSFERFIGILTEHYQGSFPVWLSPIQVAVLPISDKVHKYSRMVFEKIKESGIRVENDESNQTIGAKIRGYTLQKVPYLCIIGKKEAEKASGDAMYASIRRRDGADVGEVELSAFLTTIREEIEKRT